MEVDHHSFLESVLDTFTMKSFDFYLRRAMRCGGSQKNEPQTVNQSDKNEGDREALEDSEDTISNDATGSLSSSVVDNELDWKNWAPHHVDYAAFKLKLADNARRRKVFLERMQWETVEEQQNDDNQAEGDDAHSFHGYHRTQEEEDEWQHLLTQLYPPQPASASEEEECSSSCLGDNSGLCLPMMKMRHAPQQEDDSTDYVVFVDEDDDAVVKDSNDNKKHTKKEMKKKRSRWMDWPDALRRLAELERSEFGAWLLTQVQKSATFALRQQRAVMQSWNEVLLQKRQHLQESYQGVGNEWLEVLAFHVINIIAVRQILLRYDGYVRTFDTGAPFSEWHLRHASKEHLQTTTTTERTSPNTSSSSTYQNLFDLSSLHAALDDFVSTLHSGSLEEKEDEHTISARRVFQQEFVDQIHQFQALLDHTVQSVERAAAGHVVFRDKLQRLRLHLRTWFVLGFSTKYTECSLLASEHYDSYKLRGRHLKKEMQSMAQWRKPRSTLRMRSGNEDDYDDKDDARDSSSDSSSTLDPENVVPLLLNLWSCFLFMCNNYVIEPSSAYYANALGVSDAVSGIMIGMASWFALSAAVGYSFWTNRAYKEPLLLAAAFMVLGNLLYAIAYGYGSIGLCLTGRAIQGLGAPRIINRRYVADATPFALRTAASAAFATTTALGAALGPALAIALDAVPEFEFRMLPFGWGRVQTFNGMTGPGYFMAVLWFIYGVATVLWFREPNRSGLEELRQREQQQRKTSVQLWTSSFTSSAPHIPDKLPQGSSSHIDIELEELSKQESSKDDDDDENTDADSESDFFAFQSYKDETPHHRHHIHRKNRQWWQCGCCQHMTRAVALCMFLILAKRIALESIVGSTSIVTKNRYGWSIANVGTLHLANGIIVIPVTIMAGMLSQFYQDRHLALWFLSITLFGMLFLIDPTDLFFNNNEGYNEDMAFSVGPIQYIVGSLIAFSGIEACESYVASLMTKVTPSSLAVGTFNSGLLTTLVGTGGRALGDLFITAMGLISIRNLLNLLIIPGAALMVLAIVSIRRNYSILAV